VSGPKRGVSTVADVALALVLVSAAMVVLVTFAGTSESGHEPMETEYTTETVASATLNATYHVEPAIRAYYGGEITEETDYDRRDLRRVSHGPILAQLADIAVMNAAFSLDSPRGEVENGSRPLSATAAEYQAVVDEKLQARLVNASFRTQVSAVWEPVEGGPIRGTATVGKTPPPRTDVSATTLTVPSEFPAVRGDALAAVSAPGEFDAVAATVAQAVVEGYVPELESQHALERAGVGRDLTVSRYENLARVLDVEGEIAEHLAPESADAAAANQRLVEELATRLQEFLQPDPARTDGPLGDARAAAAAVSTGRVTVTVRTWT